MSSGKDNVPSAPLMEHETLVMVPAPPSYDETMGLSGGSAPMPQYPPQHPYPAQQYPGGQHGPSQLPYSPQPYYAVPGPGLAQAHVEPTSLHAVPMQSIAPPAVNVQYVPVGPMLVGPKPVTMVCPACRMNVKTSTVAENTTGAHLTCILLCLLGCCLCSCIPYCLDSCKKVRHTCPNCGNYLGTYAA